MKSSVIQTLVTDSIYQEKDKQMAARVCASSLLLTLMIVSNITWQIVAVFNTYIDSTYCGVSVSDSSDNQENTESLVFINAILSPAMTIQAVITLLLLSKKKQITTAVVVLCMLVSLLNIPLAQSLCHEQMHSIYMVNTLVIIIFPMVLFERFISIALGFSCLYINFTARRHLQSGTGVHYSDWIGLYITLLAIELILSLFVKHQGSPGETKAQESDNRKVIECLQAAFDIMPDGVMVMQSFNNAQGSNKDIAEAGSPFEIKFANEELQSFLQMSNKERDLVSGSHGNSVRSPKDIQVQLNGESVAPAQNERAQSDQRDRPLDKLVKLASITMLKRIKTSSQYAQALRIVEEDEQWISLKNLLVSDWEGEQQFESKTQSPDGQQCENQDQPNPVVLLQVKQIKLDTSDYKVLIIHSLQTIDKVKESSAHDGSGFVEKILQPIETVLQQACLLREEAEMLVLSKKHTTLPISPPDYQSIVSQIWCHSTILQCHIKSQSLIQQMALTSAIRIEKQELHCNFVQDYIIELLEAFFPRISKAGLHLRVLNEIGYKQDQESKAVSVAKHTYIMADWNLYQLTIFHLLENAINFTDASNKFGSMGKSDDIIIVLRLESDQNGDMALITQIIDKGIGMSQDRIQRLNSHLAQEQTEKKDTIRLVSQIDEGPDQLLGSGIQIARMLSKALDGSIEFEANTPVGTKVTVVIKVSQVLLFNKNPGKRQRTANTVEKNILKNLQESEPSQSAQSEDSDYRGFIQKINQSEKSFISEVPPQNAADKDRRRVDLIPKSAYDKMWVKSDDKKRSMKRKHISTESDPNEHQNGQAQSQSQGSQSYTSFSSHISRSISIGHNFQDLLVDNNKKKIKPANYKALEDFLKNDQVIQEQDSISEESHGDAIEIDLFEQSSGQSSTSKTSKLSKQFNGKQREE